MEDSADVTVILNEIADGKRDSLARLIPLVYDELRRLADRPRLNYLDHRQSRATVPGDRSRPAGGATGPHGCLLGSILVPLAGDPLLRQQA